MYARVRACMSVRACGRAFVRAGVRLCVCVCACMRASTCVQSVRGSMHVLL